MKAWSALWVSVVFSAFGLVPSAWAASDQIGLAVVVRNQVSQVEPKISRILSGDDIIRDEVVRTMDDSSAKFVLKDSTNLILGPNSTLKLDRAVFSDEKSVADVAIKLTLGSFRFITGLSPKESYTITTPLGSLGVRGTTLDLLIELRKNTVVLKDGKSRVCAGVNCVDLLKPGDTATITSNGNRIDIEMTSSSSWSFDSACNGMCGPMSFAQAEDSMTTGSLGGGGGAGGGPNAPLPSGGSNAGGFGPNQPTSVPTTPLLLGDVSLGNASFAPVSSH